MDPLLSADEHAQAAGATERDAGQIYDHPRRRTTVIDDLIEVLMRSPQGKRPYEGELIHAVVALARRRVNVLLARSETDAVRNPHSRPHSRIAASSP